MPMNKPPIMEVFCNLQEIDTTEQDDGYIVISFSKKNKIAMYRTIRQLQQWIDRDVYLQFRVMTNEKESVQEHKSGSTRRNISRLSGQSPLRDWGEQTTQVSEESKEEGA